MYNFIINPSNGKKYNINSKMFRSILKKYILNLIGGEDNCYTTQNVFGIKSQIRADKCRLTQLGTEHDGEGKTKSHSQKYLMSACNHYSYCVCKAFKLDEKKKHSFNTIWIEFRGDKNSCKSAHCGILEYKEDPNIWSSDGNQAIPTETYFFKNLNIHSLGKIKSHSNSEYLYFVELSDLTKDVDEVHNNDGDLTSKACRIHKKNKVNIDTKDLKKLSEKGFVGIDDDEEEDDDEVVLKYYFDFKNYVNLLNVLIKFNLIKNTLKPEINMIFDVIRDFNVWINSNKVNRTTITNFKYKTMESIKENYNVQDEDSILEDIERIINMLILNQLEN